MEVKPVSTDTACIMVDSNSVSNITPTSLNALSSGVYPTVLANLSRVLYLVLALYSSTEHRG